MERRLRKPKPLVTDCELLYDGFVHVSKLTLAVCCVPTVFIMAFAAMFGAAQSLSLWPELLLTFSVGIVWSAIMLVIGWACSRSCDRDDEEQRANRQQEDKHIEEIVDRVLAGRLGSTA